MKTARQRLAVWGEDLAADYLQQHGFVILDRNVRTPYGEIDLVARKEATFSTPSKDQPLDHPVTVFVEVKARTSTAYGYPEQAITVAKQNHLLASAQEYIRQHPELEGEWRVDVIAILRLGAGSPPQIVVFENAVIAE